jgi:nucleoporin POM152
VLNSTLLKGHPPFRYLYEHVHPDARQKTVRSVQDRQALTTKALFHLSSAVPGRNRYNILQVADSVYDFRSNGDRTIPIFTVEQTVLEGPTAVLHNKASLTYCLNDAFTKARHSAQVEFMGQPPFSIRLDIKNVRKAISEIHEVNDIHQRKWSPEIPSFIFANPGTYTVTIAYVTDASGCEWEPPLIHDRLQIEVVEPAAIKAVHERTDYCVGDTMRYILQGALTGQVEIMLMQADRSWRQVPDLGRLGEVG